LPKATAAEPGVAHRPGPHFVFARHHAIAAAPAGELVRYPADGIEKGAPMSRFSWQVGLSFLAVCSVLIGCNRNQQTPDEISQSSGSMTLGMGTVIYSQFKGRHKGAQGRQFVLICCDINGNSGLEVGDVSKHQGYLSSTGGNRRLDWQIERTDGWNVKVRLSGKEYDASKGALFLVKIDGEKTEVEQLAKDVSAAQADSKSVEEFARKDAAVNKFLGIKAD
jgi:hypothetical protein